MMLAIQKHSLKLEANFRMVELNLNTVSTVYFKLRFEFFRFNLKWCFEIQSWNRVKSIEVDRSRSSLSLG